MASSNDRDPKQVRTKQIRRSNIASKLASIRKPAILVGIFAAAMPGEVVGLTAILSGASNINVTDAWISSAQPLKVNQPATLEVTLHNSGGDTSDVQFEIDLVGGGMVWPSGNEIMPGGVCHADADNIDCGPLAKGKTKTVTIDFKPRLIGTDIWKVSDNTQKAFTEVVH